MERRITVTPAHFRPERIKRVAVYCRVSSRIDEQLRSVGSQAKYLIDKAIHHAGWAFQDIFIDICSGKKAENRPELQTMLSQGRSHLIDIILVRTISRLGRNTLDTLTICRDMKEHGVEIVFVDDNLSTMSSDGEFLLTILAAFAQADNESRRMNIKWGMQKRVKDGTSSMFRKKCYGYRNDENGQMTVYEPEARIVRWIYKSYLHGNTIFTIKRQLEETGVFSPSGNKTWCKKTITNILSNEKYYGAICIYKTYMSDYIVPERINNTGEHEFVWWFEHHVPIISKEDYMAVMEAKKERSNYETDDSGNRFRSKHRYVSRNERIEIPGQLTIN